MILFGLRDVGAVNACLPVIQILKDKSVSVSIYAEGPAYEKLKDKFLLFPEYKIDELLDLIKPSLVVATCAVVGGSVPIVLTREAKKRNLPTILIEEIWAGHSAFKWDIFPDGVCVCDEFAKDLILKSWLNYPEFNIHVTGSPIFDKFLNVQTEAISRKVREVLELSESWPIIFFPLTGQISGIVEVADMLIEALNNLSLNAYLVLRDHPSFSFSKTLEYQETAKKLKVGKIINSNKITSHEINIASDIVVGTFSTMTVEACYLRKPVLIIWTPDVSRTFIKATNSALMTWPIVNLGMSLKAETADTIKKNLEDIVAGNIDNIKLAQEKHCKTDGLSARRVAEAILRYC